LTIHNGDPTVLQHEGQSFGLTLQRKPIHA
jgi:hypothetical protein